MKGNKEKMNKLSSIGLGMAIGLTWGVAVVGVGIFVQHMLASGYNGSWPAEVINSVVLFKGLFSLVYPAWAHDVSSTLMNGLWAFTHGFIGGFAIAFNYNMLMRIYNQLLFKLFQRNF